MVRPAHHNIQDELSYLSLHIGKERNNMREAPENLDYGTSHQGAKDALESYLEKGKYDTARAGCHGAECDETALMRLKHTGSHDPMYADHYKNKP